MTAPAIDTSSIALEDIAPPCGWDGCDHIAEWVAFWSCSCVYFYCEPHKEHLALCKDVRCASRHDEVNVTMSNAERL